MYKLTLTGLLVLLTSFSVFSQSNYRAGSLTQININAKVAETWKLNTKLEARQIFSSRQPGEVVNNGFEYERTDLGFMLTKKVSADNSLGGGYMVRMEDGSFTHRLSQQFSSVNTLEVLSIAHRVVADETFNNVDPAEFRLRYRLGMELPLNGQQVDPKEFYGKFNNEYLGIFAGSNPDLEIRGLLSLGYNAADNNKLELGFEYRINGFNESVNAQQFWVTIAWFVSI
ncbi:DUF2490 domain-containing protein [Dyadobacter sp. CY345]|uniref:DUF2490 domain-containing protein n=1 Tax=Dyadobacter sp. CY345 TaxID=2909335 RepID=UPI001F1613AE|nr:DUF2490 domain-containing protein [Dyadobacter sp. CY345]MCF2447095.1 DUF2490 domain-containing protein [Dyadobacter sp. CY345]